MSHRHVLLLVALLFAGCIGVGPAPSPTPAASPTPAPSPSPSPGPQGFYLRTWMSQALPPEHTLGWLPPLTISQGTAIDGNVAIPMIFPGPLLIVPNARAISEAGQATIVDLARQLGLLEGDGDFTGDQVMPGSTTGHVVMTIDGRQVELVGDPNASGRCVPGDLQCQPEPGTAEAFAFFWARLSYLDDWLGGELGGTGQYAPERLVVVTMPPAQHPEVPSQPVAWPLESDFAEFGAAWAVEGSRCAVVEGDDLETLLPVLLAANAASVFVDSTDEARSLLVRVLVPGEPDPCG
jgi:hypothetical protein